MMPFEPFARPRGSVFCRISNFMLPPQPRDQVVYGFGEMKELFRLKHYLVAIAIAPIVFGLFWLQLYFWPWTVYGPGLLFLTGLEWSFNRGVLWLGGFFVVCMFIYGLVPGKSVPQKGSSYSKHTVGKLNRAAVREEQWFREGAERWSRLERLRSAFAFGFVHQGNWIYPIATILPLTLAGLVFNHAYLHNYKRTHSRQEAVLASALVHRVYNRVVLICAITGLVYALGKWVIGF
jgi:hypothetical protein